MNPNQTGTRGAENIRKLIPLNLDRIISFSTTDEVKNKTLRDLKTLAISTKNLSVTASWQESFTQGLFG